ncbi:MAG: hypothetical protein H6R01_1518 [Burkholderiaceae bacterium]|nr:hypothetical protein [Burkholderiaceae bacterium]
MNTEIQTGTPVKYIDTNGIEQSGIFHGWLRSRRQDGQRTGLIATPTNLGTLLETAAERNIMERQQ